jgi:hypothetical protein
MAMLVLAGLALTASSGTRAADGAAKPTVGAEILVAPDAGASKMQLRPAVAFNGEVYLVAWQDGAGTAGDKECEIWCARLDKSGKSLDEKGVLVCKAEGKEMRKRPAVAACGKDFLVVWEDYRNGKDYDLYAARVTGEGKVLDPNGFVVSGAPGVQVMPSVASDGKTGWLATWSDFRNGTDYDVYAARISPEGKVLDPNGLAIATGRSPYPSQWVSSVAWGDGGYLVNWCVDFYRFICRVTPEGKITSLPNEAGGIEDQPYNSARKSVWRLSGNGGIDDFTVLASGPGGCVAVSPSTEGKAVVYVGPRRFFAFLLGRDGRPLAPANKEHMPSILYHGEWGNPGNAVEPMLPGMLVGDGRMWHPSAAPLGRDFLVVVQLRGQYDRNYPGSADREDIVACRVQLDGTCPDRKAGSWIQIDTTPGYNKSWPNACAGPEGEVLVVYERDKAVGDRKIAARIVKK